MKKVWSISAVWAILMLAAILGPGIVPLREDSRTRFTVDIALGCYVVSVAGMLMTSASDWRSRGRTDWIRLVWSLAWLACFIHFVVAFNDVHHWSHADAVAHTRERSGVGSGIFASHLFTIVWALDVAWWWVASVRYVNRPAWLGWCLHGFLAFMAFNGAVVFEDGPIRWAGSASTVLLAMLLVRRVLFDQRKRPPHIA